MTLTDPVDLYCERLVPGLWAEPVNAATNLAFVLAAALMWRRTEGIGRVLTVVLGLIGLASGAFHTHAVGWTGAADSLAILLFVLIYLYAANRRFWGLGPGWALGATLLFVPYSAALVPVFSKLPLVGGSAVYLPLPVLIGGYAVALRNRAPGTARGLALGAGMLILSLTAGMLDAPLCGIFPMGTHWLWHLLNAAMLAWMIDVLHRHPRPMDAVAASG